MKQKSYIFLSILIFSVLFASALYPQPRGTLRQRWTRASKKLQFARELQVTFNNRIASDILVDAKRKLIISKNQIRSRRVVLASRSLIDVEKLTNRAIREILKEPVRIRLNKLDKKIEKAKQVVGNSNNQEAKNMLDKGINNKRIAVQSFKANEFQQALKHFRQAEFQIQKSIDLVKNRDKSTKQKAEEEAHQFDQLLNQLKPGLSKNKTPTVQKKYRSALKLSREAAEAIADKNFSLAIDLYYQATRLLLRTRDLAEGKIDRTATRAYEDVAELDEQVANIKRRIKPFKDNERIQFFMSHIEQLQADAHKALNDRNYSQVLLNTEYAWDLIEQVQKKLRGKSNNLGELLGQELNQLEIDLGNINDRLESSENRVEAKILLNYATMAKSKAEQLLTDRKFRFAREAILEANRFAFAADRLIRNQNLKKISSEFVMDKIFAVDQEIANFQSRIAEVKRPDIQVYLDYAQKMLTIARENVNNNYLYVADECSEASKTAIEKLKTIFK